MFTSGKWADAGISEAHLPSLASSHREGREGLKLPSTWVVLAADILS